MATVKALVVGGGGGGGTHTTPNYGGGGGGGGGVIENNSFSINAGQSYTITIGTGGGARTNGNNSTFSTLTALGGGYGGYNYGSGGNGGCGGGGAYGGGAGIGSQGYNGATSGGTAGGGGGGSAGSGKNGGSGYTSSITGSSVKYAGGGGGGTGGDLGGIGQDGGGDGGSYNFGSGVSGTANTGGGGGGAAYGGSAGSGGSGIVIISYITADFTAEITGTGNTKTTNGANTICTFITDGTFIIPNAPTVSTTSMTASTLSIDAVGNVTSDGGSVVTERGFCYNITGTPTILDFKSVVSGTTGSYNKNISGLLGETTYHLRAYATNSIGTSYGDEIDVFIVGKPLVTTNTVTNIDITSSTGNGNITSDSGSVITERGFCWNTSTNPTTANSKVIVSGTTGSYSGSLTSLSPNTLYYVRSYAINQYGITYGDNVTFTSLSLGAKQLVKNIGAIDGQIYAVQIKTVITSGTITVKLGTTGYSSVITTTGTHVIQGDYGGLSGLIVESSDGFVGTVDDIFWVLVLGTAVIDWSATTLTNLIPVNGIVKFRRVEDKEITRFNLYRYIDTLFKDLDGYITITVTEEANDLSADRSKIFIVGNTVGTPSPFVKKRISILSKNQAIILQYANNKLNETFTICSYSLTGFKEVRKLYKPDSIISI